MARRKQNVQRLEEMNLQQECMRIAQQNIPNVELWLQILGKIDPAKAIKAWVEITEFAQAKKSKDNNAAPQTMINIQLVPAQRLSKGSNECIDITPIEPE